MTNSHQITSFDTASPELRQRLTAFLETEWRTPVQVSDLRRFPAGLSWITIGFTALLGEDMKQERRELILRIGDPGGLLAPYRAEPEYLALSALANSPGLPIPNAYTYSDDHSVLGAPFLVTQWVIGDTPMPWKGADAGRDDATTLSLGNDFVDALCVIHKFDWQHSSLSALSQNVAPDDVALHEVRFWSAHAGVPDEAPPQMHYAMRWLETHAPVADHITVVHGDYRVGNFLQQDGRITAILDWELVHLGDPHEDLAWAGLRTFSAGTTRIGGLIERDAFFDRYQAKTGFQIRPQVISYYEVLVQFKMAAMLIGAVRRIESGRARDVRMAAMAFQLASSLMELNRLIGATL